MILIELLNKIEPDERVRVVTNEWTKSLIQLDYIGACWELINLIPEKHLVMEIDHIWYSQMYNAIQINLD